MRKSPRSLVQKHCAFCGKEMYVRPSRIEKSASGLVFCSHSCSSSYKYSFLASNAQCEYCKQLFYRSPSELSKRPTDHTYCSRKCYDLARQEGIAAKRNPSEKSNTANAQCAYCDKPLYRRPSQLKKPGNLFCSHECKRRFQITTGNHVPRDYLKNRWTHCQICSLAEKDILVIHHKDGNRKNNNLDNLIVVCPNCHMRIHKGLIQGYR